MKCLSKFTCRQTGYLSSIYLRSEIKVAQQWPASMYKCCYQSTSSIMACSHRRQDSFVLSRPSFQFATVRSPHQITAPTGSTLDTLGPLHLSPFLYKFSIWPGLTHYRRQTKLHTNIDPLARDQSTGPRFLLSSVFLHPSLAYVKLISLCRCDF